MRRTRGRNGKYSTIVFPYDRMCSLTTECVLLYYQENQRAQRYLMSLLQNVFPYDRMCSLTTECVPLRQNVFLYDRMCSLVLSGGPESATVSHVPTIECVPLRQNVFSCTIRERNARPSDRFTTEIYDQMCPPSIECVLLV